MAYVFHSFGDDVLPGIGSIGFQKAMGLWLVNSAGKPVAMQALNAMTFVADDLPKEMNVSTTGTASFVFGQLSGNAGSAIAEAVARGEVVFVQKSSIATGSVRLAFAKPSVEAYALACDGSRSSGLKCDGEYAVLDGSASAIEALAAFGSAPGPKPSPALVTPGPDGKCPSGMAPSVKRVTLPDGTEKQIPICVKGVEPTPPPKKEFPTGPGGENPQSQKLPGWVVPTIAGVSAIALISLVIAGSRKG
jgi:hypothetical protein